jgi:cyanate lyase
VARGSRCSGSGRLRSWSWQAGDGILGAIDFSMDLQRQPDPKGDRVSITMSGKFLPYGSH